MSDTEVDSFVTLLFSCFGFCCDPEPEKETPSELLELNSEKDNQPEDFGISIVDLAKINNARQQNLRIVYILELENGKYYVGETGRYENRFRQHFTGQGAEFTKLNKPKSVMRIIIAHDNNSKEIEKKVTLELMKIYGRNNVRGASWCSKETTKYFPNKNTVDSTPFFYC